MPSSPEETILSSARDLVRETLTKEAGLSGHSEKILTAVAYYIRATSLGRHLSMYDAEEMFSVADTPFRSCYKRMAEVLNITKVPFVKERSRNAYDIYAEILRNDGVHLNTLIRNVHVSYGETRKHVSFLIERGLLKRSVKGRSRTFSPTEKGLEYLALYDRLHALTARDGRERSPPSP